MPGGWERLASHEGGSVVALATARTDGGPALFAATAAGLFSSVDGGRSWSPTGNRPLPLIAAVMPSARFAENRLLFAGTQTGFHRSTDAGHTWRQTLSGGCIFAIAALPDTDTGERIFIGTEEDGILRSDDGGQTWTGANAGLLDLTVLALAFSPDAARDQTGFAATASGLSRTRNGGKSWRETELPRDEAAVQCLVFSPAFAHDRLILAGTEGDGLWRSDDGGATWDSVPGLPEGGIRAISFSTQFADSRLVAVATTSGVALSRDGGETWQLTGQTLPPVLSLAFAPHDTGETLVAGLHRDGIARLNTREGGDHWTPANTGLGAALLTTLVASPAFAHDRTLFVAGPEAGVWVSRDGGLTWADAGASLADVAVHGLAVSPNAGDAYSIVAATSAGIYRSRDGGASWEPATDGGRAPTGIVVAGMAADGDPAPIFAATRDGGMIASDDGGAGWHSLDTPFDEAMVISLTCSPAYAHDRTLYVGTMQPTAIAGVNEATVWRSTDGGTRWARWLEASGGSGLLPLAVAPSAHGEETVFVGLPGRVLQPRRNAWETRNGVRAPLWRDTPLTMDGGNPVAITALASSPRYRTDGTVFAATSVGVYRSRTHGRGFDRWNDDLPPAPILALATATAAHDAFGGAPVVFALGVNGTIWRRPANS